MVCLRLALARSFMTCSFHITVHTGAAATESDSSNPVTADSSNVTVNSSSNDVMVNNSSGNDTVNLWIMKPVGLSRGRGISMVHDIT